MPLPEKTNPSPPPGTYWVIPGELLAGGNPASKYFEDQSRTRLRQLLDAGIQVFIDLTCPAENAGYQNLLQEQAGWLDLQAEYHRYPVTDFSIPDLEWMMQILDCIDAARNEGKAVFVHCQAGIGRTGCVIGCYLVRHGTQPKQALAHLARLRRGLPTANIRSPESEAQLQMILNWKTGQ